MYSAFAMQKLLSFFWPKISAYLILYVLEDLTLKAPVTTAADDIHNYFFIVFPRKYDLMFQVNPLLGRGFT